MKNEQAIAYEISLSDFGYFISFRNDHLKRGGKQGSIRKRLKLNRGARRTNQPISLSIVSLLMSGMKIDSSFVVVTGFSLDSLLLPELLIGHTTILQITISLGICA
jgi:hypothetical protein